MQKRTMIKDYCPGYYEVVAGGVVGVSKGGEGGREGGERGKGREARDGKECELIRAKKDDDQGLLPGLL